MSNIIFNKNKKIKRLRKIYGEEKLKTYVFFKIWGKKKIKGTFALEAIIVISLLLIGVKQLSSFFSVWLKKFYMINSILFLVNSYIDSGTIVSTATDQFNIEAMDEKMIIVLKEKKEGEAIKNAIEQDLKTKERTNFFITLKENRVEILKKEIKEN